MSHVGRTHQELVAVLQAAPAFAGLTPEAAGWLASRSEIHDVAAGDVVGKQGESADAMFVVLAGQLEIVVDSRSGEHVHRIFRRGEVIGVLSMLAEIPRIGTLRATRDSTVLRIDELTFEELLASAPSFAEALARMFAGFYAHARTSVLRPTEASLLEPPAPVRVVALVGIGDASRVPVDAFIATLARWGSVVALRSSPAASFAVALDRALDVATRAVTIADARADAADARATIRQSDVALVFVPPDAPLPDPALARTLRGCHLVFVGRSTTPSTIGGWLDRVSPGGHHFLDPSDERSIRRSVRRTIGRSIGIVLSGGGARGLAHIGVIDALQREGVEIDRVGGCSMGAFVGAMLASGMTPEQMMERCTAEFVHRNPFADYTVPRTSLIRAQRAKSMLRRTFGDTSIETMLLDFYCVTADLLSGETVVHRRGPLYRAVGASMSLPGLAPPVRYGRRLLVDGGVLDNLPVDVMAARPEGDIIAVDVMRRISSERGASAAPAMPSILETLTRATALGSWSLGARSSAYASLTIAPALDAVGTFEWRSLSRIVDAGRRAVDDALRHEDLARWKPPEGQGSVTWWGSDLV